MVEYGYMDNGFLRSRIIEPRKVNYKDEKTGNIKTRIKSVEEQLKELDAAWKPVDPVDESKRVTDEGYIIRLVPYDAGDHISYNYVRVFDTQKVMTQIKDLKRSLAESDYKVAKCNEANLLGEPLPYDINALHSERQSKRDQVNQLQILLNQKQ
jgi:hypothetical protein